MTTLGKIEEFDIRSGKIDRYLARLEQYFEANGIPPDTEDSHKQRAILISVFRVPTASKKIGFNSRSLSLLDTS